MGLLSQFVSGLRGQQGAGPQLVRGVVPARRRESWILAAEHGLLRVVSFLFSAASAYAIARVFAPSAPGDYVRQAVDFVIAGGFGVLGYFLSRSIAYRLFMKEPVWSYLPICLVVEFVEVFCNYVLGVSEVPHAAWLQNVPVAQQPYLTGIAYVVLSIIPVVTIFLAVADMDLERKKHHRVTSGGPAQPKQVNPSVYSQGYQAQQPAATYQRGGAPNQGQWQQQGGMVNGNSPLQGAPSGPTR
ncbi:MAG TPA: hypothetical protein VFB60_06880 [Ktedonobacteraceae bacterium]|nr:hypothetical protein [Ktedonobacteraceae bacterium]